MRTVRNRVSHKHFQLDNGKIRQAQKVLRAKTETETIHRALDVVIAEHRRNQMAARANEQFLKSGIEVKDVYSKLAK